MMKKLTALLTALFLLLSATALADEVIHIGIIQFAEHGSLDNCRIGFIEGLAEEGFVEGENVVFDVQNAQADTAISAQIVDVMAGKYDMICAIATPAAMAAFNAAEDAGIPVIYTAVSDPVSAMLAGADGKNPGNITGTSDALRAFGARGRFWPGRRFGLGGRHRGRGGRALVLFVLAAHPVRQAQPVHLADHRVAGHPAQFLGDLAGRLALVPHALERLDTLVRPGHPDLRLS